jgi:hypothetical protein
MSKRFAAAGVVCAALFAVAAVSYAQGATKTFTDPKNRFTFQYPASLPVDTVERPNQPLNVLVGAADYECQMFVVDRPESASSPPDAVVRAYTTALAADVWKRSADGFALYNRQGTVQSATVDTTKFWPVQTASLRTDENKPVVAAMQARPGFEIWQFCTGFDNRDHTTTFNQIIASFAGPNDAALQAQAEAANANRSEAQKAAAQAQADAAAKASQQPAQEKKKKISGRAQAKDLH